MAVLGDVRGESAGGLEGARLVRTDLPDSGAIRAGESCDCSTPKGVPALQETRLPKETKDARDS